MTLLTMLGVTEILCSFRLVLEGKTGKGSKCFGRKCFGKEVNIRIPDMRRQIMELKDKLVK